MQQERQGRYLTIVNQATEDKFYCYLNPYVLYMHTGKKKKRKEGKKGKCRKTGDDGGKGSGSGGGSGAACTVNTKQ